MNKEYIERWAFFQFSQKPSIMNMSMNNEQISMSAPTSRLIRLGDGAFITVVMNGESLTVRASDSQVSFDKALEAYKNEDWDALYEAMRPVKTYCFKVDGVTVTENGVFFNDEPIHTALSTRIMDFAMSGLDHKPLCKFLEKLMNNPSRRAVQELYTFLEHQNLPITDNGNFLAYKGLSKDYYSITSGSAKLIKGYSSHGRILNVIDEVIEMKRNDVDDDKERGCSYGLHAGTMEYARGFAQGKCVIVEINPEDVVSIPTDCSFQKLRTCRYKVVGEFEAPLYEPCYESRWVEDDLGYDEDDEDNYHWTDSFETPNSAWIEEVSYDSEDESLRVYLRDGECMHYVNVNPETYLDFQKWVQDDKSAGKYYHTHIKNHYDTI
jgi:hypothetical protein